jgi:hypothetical protein
MTGTVDETAPRLLGDGDEAAFVPQPAAGRGQGLPLITAKQFALVIWWEHTATHQR